MKKTIFTFLFIAGFIHYAHAQEFFRSDFNSPTELQNWTQLKVPGWPEKWRTAYVSNGQLIIEPKAATWYEDSIGGHLYRAVTGNFIITARINVTGINTPLPQTEYSLAGILLRAPRALTSQNWQRGQENWLFLSAGAATPPGQSQLEMKTTQNSKSTLNIIDNPPGWQDLRIVRYGTTFYLLQRPAGGQWRQLNTYSRPEMPQTLWAGITAYSDWGSSARVYPDFEMLNQRGAPSDNADLRAYIDFIDIRPYSGNPYEMTGE